MAQRTFTESAPRDKESSCSYQSALSTPPYYPDHGEHAYILQRERAAHPSNYKHLSRSVVRSSLAARQSARTVVFARHREAYCLAWTMFCHVPRRTWMVLSFCYRLRTRAMTSERAVARRAAEALRARVLELRAAPPQPLTSYDVGVAEDGSLLYRSERGAVSSDHPRLTQTQSIVGLALQPDGSLGPPLQPPAHSPFDLCPDTSGAICYVDRDHGSAQWDAPSGSVSLMPRSLMAHSLQPPPAFPPGLGFASLHGTQWHPLYSDHQGRVHLYHAETGAVREAPWICVRDAKSLGRVYYINLITGSSRWLPPHRWMECWVSRPNSDPIDGTLRDSLFDGHRLSQLLLPMFLARQRTECGAPPLYYERGIPQFTPDHDDTPDTHPACSAIRCAS